VLLITDPKVKQLPDAQCNWACGSKAARKNIPPITSRKMDAEVLAERGKSENKYHSRYARRVI